MRTFIVAFFLAVKSIARGNIGVTLLTITMLTLANLNLLEACREARAYLKGLSPDILPLGNVYNDLEQAILKAETI